MLHKTRSLIPILSPLTTKDYTVYNTHYFVCSLKNTNADKLFRASFDIENSLIVNFPVTETINITIDKLFVEDNSNVIELAKKS